jgi:predicted alpha-1,2-mannosidase
MRFYLLPLAVLSTLFLSRCGNDSSIPHVAFNWNVDSAKYDFAKYVDPMIGTAGHGHTFPGACAPFGMVQLSPDTRKDDSWDGCSGYHYDDDTIYGFSHTHLSGTGCSDYGDILFMPGNDKSENDRHVFSTRFSHRNEKAEAGYYSVVLDSCGNHIGTKIELTTSPRVGVHRYTFANDEENQILLDLVHRDEVIDSKLEIVDDHTIQGYRFSKAWANDQRVYFYAEFSRDFSSSKLGMAVQPEYEKEFEEKKSFGGKYVKVAFTFSDGKSEPIILKVALSAVSCENAKLNMQTEVPDFDFDAVHKKVVQQWNNELGKIEVKSGDETKKKIFYTALYHCFISPNLYCDVNGDYRGRDNLIHRDTLHPQYTVFSLWDTYRALHPLFTIIQQKRDQDFISTFVKQAQEGGMLPVWELSANETNCMIGYHSVPVIVDAWMKGLTDFDTATAYEAMVHSAMQDNNGLAEYKKFGYIPAESEGESVSKTLEYAYDDWCISLAAKRMKNQEDFNYFSRRAQSWKNLYDPKTGFFRPRLNNSFVEPFDPSEVNFHYTEANAWQYSLAVQQDIPGLINAHGGDEKFITFLDSLFSHSSKTSGREQADITGLIGQYAQGNEPSHHMAYLYDYTSQQWKTQILVSKICNEMYTEKPDGLCGNEDCGQMSAWYVLSSIGFYQTSPCWQRFLIGSPQFSEVIFHLENGKDFSLTAKNVNHDNRFVRSHSSNINSNQITFNTILNGGAVDFEMSNIKSVDDTVFARGDLNRFWLPIPQVPIITNINGRTFVKQMKIELGSNNSRFPGKYVEMRYNGMDDDPDYFIFYNLNNEGWVKYSTPILITENSKIQTFAKWENLNSDTSFAEFFKAPDYKSITITNPFAAQYAAGGNRALIDGIRGEDNFHTGDWQGYEGKDLEAIVDIGSVKDISHIAIGFLQDQNAWIFFPSEVVFYSSMDGKNFTEIETNKNTFKQDSQTTLLHDFYTDKKTKARYIKVVAKNIGTCPDWHPGKGKPAWIFADEIVIQ